MLYRAVVLGIVAALLSASLPARSQQNCVALPVVGGEGTEVEKTPSAPNIPIPIPLPGPIGLGAAIRHNWNTDWAVPGGELFKTFVVTLVPGETDDYNIEVYLKYPDETSDKVYDERKIDLTEGEHLVITAEPRSDLQPYQVNVEVGGFNEITDANRYKASVAGCK
ncbi:MAG: hypothetical protein F6K19_14475 [Cyanothece sp. SIO1E1]|nr:hypothetical protein [Cyanothece sp. SIO1E1]